MSHPRSNNISCNKSRTDVLICDPTKVEDNTISCDAKNGIAYSVTVSKKSSDTNTCDNITCSGQKSFISIHSTDQLCQIHNADSASKLDECNVEVLSLKEAFPSTSEESLVNDDDDTSRKPKLQIIPVKSVPENSKYTPSNSKSTTNSGRRKDLAVESQAGYLSDFDIPKNTMHVVGSNPGEPKMSYNDPPKKISKTMKKFLRNIDKYKVTERPVTRLSTRGILKDGRCVPESKGDTLPDSEMDTPSEPSLGFSVDLMTASNYTKHSSNPDKNVTFNTQVIIIHFTGDLCVGQSVETLSKEKDQQARNCELRRTFLNKYNEFWPAQK